MQKRILIIGNSFYPENSPRAFRTTELAKEFSRQGHDVTVLVPKNNIVHNSLEKEYNFKIKDLGRLPLKDVSVESNNGIINILNRGIKRGLNLFFEYPNIGWMFKVKKALKKESGYDLIISIAVPHPIHWGTAIALQNKVQIAKKWVADCGDPYMGSKLDTFNKMFYFKYIEKYWCEKADYITVPIEGAKEGYYKEYRKKIKIIPQGFNFKEVKIDGSNYKQHQIPTFAYAGQLMPGIRDPKILIEYLLSLRIDFKFILYTRSVGMVNPYLDKAKEKIEIRDYIPRNKLLTALSKMDFLINFNNGVSTQLPSKLIDYYLTKRPVLSIDSFSLNKRNIDEFLKGDYTNQFKYEKPDQYKIENVCNQFLSLIE